MKVSIEEINGKQYTVIRHMDLAWAGKMDIEENVKWLELNDGSLVQIEAIRVNAHFATALPALPKHLKPDEKTIRDFCAYRAAGIKLMETAKDGKEEVEFVGMLHNGRKSVNLISGGRAFGTGDVARFSMTHATYKGERVEIAREG